MKKDKKFLLELEQELKEVDKYSRNAIILKYREIIDKKVNENIKIKKILNDLGSPSEIAKREIEEYNKNKKSKLKSFFSFITRDIQLSHSKKKNKKERKEKKEKKEKNNKENKLVSDTKILIGKIISNKSKKENTDIEISDNVVNDVIEKEENIESKIEEAIIVENDRRKTILKVLSIILFCLLLFIWLWISVVMIASLFAILDGVKLYGISITLIGIDLLVLYIILKLYNIFRKNKDSIINKKMILFSLVFIIAIGIALSVYEIYKIECVSDVSEKYSMQRKIETYPLPKDENAKMYIIFNSNYDTQYIINYDDNLDGKFKLEVDYYESYYDYYVKQSSNNIYVSLRKDSRDMISTYISDLKDRKIYSKDELSRYVVKINISKKDYSRLVIED